VSFTRVIDDGSAAMVGPARSRLNDVERVDTDGVAAGDPRVQGPGRDTLCSRCQVA
jgi:hypothetical protein